MGWSRFYLSGDSLLCTSVCVSLSWVNGERGHARARFVSCECSGPWTLGGLVVIGDSSMVGVMVSRESNWLN